MEPLEAISPIDGRYRKNTAPLAQYFSEAAFMKFRLAVEGEYLIMLSQTPGTKIRPLKLKEIKYIRSLYNLPPKEAQIISDIELKGFKNIKATDHDTKSVEYYLKYKLTGTSLEDLLEWTHFALTSEDTINLAYGLMISESVETVLVPKLREIIKTIKSFANQYANLPMLARTHGQPASPTTFGKEFNVFAHRLKRGLDHLMGQKILVKLNGATGNYNAHVAAFPKIKWLKFSENFVTALNKKRMLPLELNLVTTQIEPHDSYIELFDHFRRLNTILIGFNQDMWRYVSDEWIAQKPIGSVGSSTMPHKINPIKFENSEGNLGLANALFEFFARKLPISRLQRDLSDSTVQRNIGTAFAHCLVAYDYLLKGLSKIFINKVVISGSIKNNPEVVSEAIQTILRKEGEKLPYEKLKEFTRGKEVTLKDIHKFIDHLDIDKDLKKSLKKITPANYIGLAQKLGKI